MHLSKAPLQPTDQTTLLRLYPSLSPSERLDQSRCVAPDLIECQPGLSTMCLRDDDSAHKLTLHGFAITKPHCDVGNEEQVTRIRPRSIDLPDFVSSRFNGSPCIGSR